VLAAGAALLLSSCSSNPPGVAADVDGQRITDHQVDDFAKVLCSLSSQGGSATQPSRSARFSSLQILLADELAAGMTDLGSVSETAVSQAMQQLATSRDALPESLKSTFDTVAREYAQAQTAIIELGRKSLESQGKKNVSDQDALAEGERLRTQYANKADVKVDPRFGTMVDGQLQSSDGSLSVPVSDFARQASAAQPSAALVSQLPASQKCS
jgi:hypothetical protein